MFIVEVLVNMFFLLGIGGFVGIFSGMFGVGGGFLIILLLFFVGIFFVVVVVISVN